MSSTLSVVACNIANLSSDRGFHEVDGECRVTFLKDRNLLDSSDVIVRGSFTNISVGQTVADLRFNIKCDQNNAPIIMKDPVNCYRSDMTKYFSEWIATIHSKEDIHWWTPIMIINFVIANRTVDSVKELREIEVDLTSRTITVYWGPKRI